MFNSICNKKGITLIEVMVSLVLITVGILGLLTLLPSSWRLAGRSDLLGKASGMLMTQLHNSEAFILNPNNAPAAGTITLRSVYPGGQGVPKPGDTPFTVQTTTKNLGGSAWLVTVQVTWPGNTTGISESMRVVPQQIFTQ
jgi:Tfp pilus assembly protein PilE